MKNFLFFASFLIPLLLCAQVQPQFKFYLAFEDAKNEKDTVWVVIDDSASGGFNDTVFGEGKVPLDSSKFQVYYGLENDSAWKLRAAPIGGGGTWSSYIQAQNHQLPITMRWDTNLLKNHDLPFELKQAWAENNQFNEFGPGVIDFFEVDSVILDTFYQGGGVGDHFPLNIFFSKNPPPDYGGLPHIGKKSLFKIYPNPASDILQIQSATAAALEYCVFLGVNVIYCSAETITEGALDISNLPPGYYILQIFTKTYEYEYHAFIKN